MPRIDFRKAFRSEIYRQPMVTPGSKDSAPLTVGTAPPFWRRLLRAPFSLARRFLVGGLHAKLDELMLKSAKLDELMLKSAKLDELALKTEALQAQIMQLQGLVGDRIHQLDIKIRGPLAYDEHTDAIRLTDGYVLVPKGAQKLRIMLADAPADGLEPGTCRVIRKLLDRGMTAVDIGANVGALTLTCARAVGPSGKVYAFEPEPAFASLLNHTFDLNGIDWIDVRQSAISRHNGRATFYVSPIGGHSSLYELPPDERRQQVAIEVETIRLDDVVRPGTAVDLVKIDVEGGELDVLDSMPETIKANPELTIIAEYGPSHLARQNITTEEWIDRFLSFGFSIFMIDELTGRCEPASTEKLKHMHSVNLVMTRFDTRTYRILTEAT